MSHKETIQEKNNISIMEKFPKLSQACSKYPEIELHVNSPATLYESPKSKAKNGFIENFCK